jgi:hypothetical protein
MDLDSFLVSLYVLTEDWWKATHSLNTPGAGRPALISDPEILTLSILAQWPRFHSERDFFRFANAHLRQCPPAPILPHASVPKPVQSEGEGFGTRDEISPAPSGGNPRRGVGSLSCPGHYPDPSGREGEGLSEGTVRWRSHLRQMRLDLVVGLRLEGRPLGQPGGRDHHLLLGRGLRRRAAHRGDPSPEGRPRRLPRRQGFHGRRVGETLVGALRGSGGCYSAEQLQQGMAEGGSFVGFRKAPDHRGGHKPTQRLVLPGAPQGEDSPRASGALGVKDHRLHLRAVPQLPSRSSFPKAMTYPRSLLGKGAERRIFQRKGDLG